MIKKIVYIFILALTTLHTFATDNLVATLTDANIYGHILDATTKKHLPFASVTVKGTQIGTVSDASGHFFLKHLPVGEIVLEFSMIGYTTISQEIVTSKNNTIEVNINMKEHSEMLDNVVVTSNKYETKQREAASMINVVSPTLFNITSSINIAEVLDYQTGLRVENTCGNCGFPQLRINGLEGQYSQILLDSRPMFSSLASVYGLEHLPTGMIDRAEVLRGGGSALYGSSAIGGVLNIITKEPAYNQASIQNQSALVGNNSYDINTTLNSSFVTDNRKIGVFLFGVVRNRNEYDRDNDGFSEIPMLNSSLIGFRSYFKVSDYTKLTVEYHHTEELRRGGNLMDRPPHEADIAEQVKHRIDAGSAKYDIFSKDEKHLTSLYFSAQHINRDSYYGAGKDPNAYGKSKDLTAVAGGQYRYTMNRFLFMPADLSAGIEYSYNKLEDLILGYNRETDQKVHVLGSYLQNEWKNDYWSLLIGARLEKHSLMNNLITSPRANIRYTPIEAIVLRLSYAHGYRAQQIYNEDLHVSVLGGNVTLIEVSPDLRPEYAHSLSASADYYKKIGHVETNITFEGFYTRLNDVFVLEENAHDTQGNLILLRTNAPGATVSGINLEAKANYKKYLNLQLGFTYQQSKYIEPITWSLDPTIAPQSRMFRSPDTYGYLTISSSPFKAFNASLTGKYTGGMLVQHFAGYVAHDEEVMTPSFFELGAKVSYEVPLYRIYSMELNLGVKNILDSFQKDIDQGPNRDAAYIYGPSVPRTIFIGVKINL